jgi:hypothetical protein
MTEYQIQQLKSLGELLANGTITKEEFNVLKSEILSESHSESSQPIKDNASPKITDESNSVKTDKHKIRLVGFHNSTTGKRVPAPKIEYLDIKNMSKEEVKQLRAFLRLKQIFAPYDMTNDEIKIGNKLFSQLDIERINAERPGFNFPWAVIISVLTAGLSLFLMYISPCFGFLGAGTGMLSATVISIYVLTKISATKLDKILSVVAIILSIGALIAYQSHFSSETMDTSSKGTEQDMDYSNLVNSKDNGQNNSGNIQNNNSYEHEERNSEGNRETMMDAMEKITDPTYCSLCQGTGVEVNRARGMGLGDDEYGRICPMCNGDGKRSY